MKGKHGKCEEAEDRRRGGKCRKDGGDPGADAKRGRSPKPAKADGNPFVFKEAEADSGKNVGKIGGVKTKSRADRKRGGSCHARGGHAAEGASHASHHTREGRASGGGADVNPYSSAGRSLRKS